ncbi:MAG: hypothetical protein NWF01_08045 [Candidatus Bathyarchaeota archaeon]|nr:hypothetical protein [Candidatus Bathyarchaeota archaeon]
MEHSKIITAIIVVTLIVSLVVATNEFCLWAKQKVVDDELAVQSQFVSCLTQIQSQVTTDLNMLNQSLTATANQLATVDLQSAEANSILSQLSNSNAYIVNCAICDVNDVFLAVQPEQYNNIIGQDISNQAQNIVMHQTLMPQMSNLTALVEGFSGVVMVAPVFDDACNLKGSVSIVILPSQIMNGTVTEVLSGTEFKAWAVQTNGTVIFDQNATKIGSTVRLGTSRIGNFTFNTRIGTLLSNPTGTLEYNVPSANVALGTYVREQCHWTSVDMYNNSWRLAVIRDISR